MDQPYVGLITAHAATQIPRASLALLPPPIALVPVPEHPEPDVIVEINADNRTDDAGVYRRPDQEQQQQHSGKQQSDEAEGDSEGQPDEAEETIAASAIASASHDPVMLSELPPIGLIGSIVPHVREAAKPSAAGDTTTVAPAADAVNADANA